ncbi:MAG: CDP-6-deoxy-delta-3,4-glucoseen reductase [bacterium]
MTYTINITPSQHQFTADDNELILDAALKAGIAFPYGCRSGVCGSCLGDLVTGEVDYPYGEPMGIGAEDMAEGKHLFCQAVAKSNLTLHIPEIQREQDIQVKTLPARVQSLRKLAPDVMEMSLKLPSTERLQFLAGQYIDFLLADGKRRSFSIANAPFNDEYLELHLRHVDGGFFTDHVFNDMQEKALVRIEGPHGSFYLRNQESDQTERPLIFMAGGTGFAPLKAMMEQLIEAGSQRPVHLYWGVRAKQDLYSDYLAKTWAMRYPHVQYIPVLSEPKAEDNWDGRTGFVHQAVAEDFADLSNHDVYMSGPPPMILAAREAFTAQGLPQEQLYSDAFEYSEDARTAMADA